MTPKLSIIIAVYNAALYLQRTLDSVCNQTFKDLEIICVNDGSTDESPAILAKYAAMDSRILVITHEENRGSPSARNSGLDAAKGEAIGIVDADDVIGKNFYAELWNVYENDCCDIAKGRLKERMTDGTWREINYNRLIKEDPYNFNNQWTSAIYRASFIRRYGLRLSTEMPMGQDVLFLLQLIGHSPRIGVSDKAIYYYLRNNTSMTKSQPADFHLFTNLKIARKLKQYLPQYPQGAQRRKAFEIIIKFLYLIINDTDYPHDWTPHLPAIKSILADGPAELPHLRRAQEAKTVRELSTVLKIIITCLGTKSLRAKVRESYS